MFKELFKKVIVCPHCGQRSKVPIKPGKVLLITCPGCKNKFEIKFDNPVDALKRKTNQSHRSPQFDLKSLLNQFRQYPRQRQWMLIALALMMLLSFRSCLTPPVEQRQMQYQDPRENNEEYNRKDFLDI